MKLAVTLARETNSGWEGTSSGEIGVKTGAVLIAAGAATQCRARQSVQPPGKFSFPWLVVLGWK